MMQSSLIMGVLSSLAVVVRIYTKSSTTAGIAKDDGCIWLALAVYWAYIGVLLWSVFDGGGGLDMPNFLIHKNMDGVTIFLKVFSP